MGYSGKGVCGRQRDLDGIGAVGSSHISEVLKGMHLRNATGAELA
jgi:hypothetical protein